MRISRARRQWVALSGLQYDSGMIDPSGGLYFMPYYTLLRADIIIHFVSLFGYA